MNVHISQTVKLFSTLFCISEMHTCSDVARKISFAPIALFKSIQASAGCWPFVALSLFGFCKWGHGQRVRHVKVFKEKARLSFYTRRLKIASSGLRSMQHHPPLWGSLLQVDCFSIECLYFLWTECVCACLHVCLTVEFQWLSREQRDNHLTKVSSEVLTHTQDFINTSVWNVYI